VCVGVFYSTTVSVNLFTNISLYLHDFYSVWH